MVLIDKKPLWHLCDSRGDNNGIVDKDNNK